VLLLYDCCHAIPATTSVSGSGVKEYIAACGFEGIAPEVGPNSFTNALIEELGMASHDSISVGELYARLIGRLRTWKPCMTRDEHGQFRFNSAGEPFFERPRRRTPIHCALTNKRKPRSIILSRMAENPIAEPRRKKNRRTCPQGEGGSIPNEIISLPRVIISVRVDTEKFDFETWLDWIKDIPPEAANIKVEGVYGSLSTLILLRMPITTWSLLPDDPAYSFVGFTTTTNLVPDFKTLEQGTILAGLIEQRRKGAQNPVKIPAESLPLTEIRKGKGDGLHSKTKATGNSNKLDMVDSFNSQVSCLC
jgi:hypothetical protein